MKRGALVVLAVLALFVSNLHAAAPAPKGDPLEALKNLAGRWEGTGMEGKPVKVDYTVTAGGSAVMEQIDPGGEHSMVTMYHKDGDRLMMTHFCASGNQPRMRAAALPADGKTISFSFLDATNLAKPSDGHMVKLVLSMPDTNHLTEEWTYRANGKDDTTVFSLTRAQ
jgi:hypothetical protein